MKFKSLTQLKAKSLPAGKHCDGQGLWLIKRNAQFGNWILRLTINGKRREMGLGPWPEVNIAEARERASKARFHVRDGIDPIAERLRARSKAKGLSFAEAVDGCFEARKAQLKGDGVPGQWLSPLKVHVVPKIGSTPIIEIDQHVLKPVFEPIWHEKPVVARKAINRIHLTMKHAAALGLDVDMSAVEKTKALLGKQRHSVSHIPSLPYSEAPTFYRWLCGLENTSAIALRFLLLTATRTSEVRFASLDEFEGDVWILPADRTKTGVKHRVPITKECKKVVEIAKGNSSNGYLFTSARGKPLSDAAMSKFMRENGYEARPHGLRATFRTWVEEQTETPFEVKESALGHAVDAGVVGAYQRSDRLERRRELLERWDSYLTR